MEPKLSNRSRGRHSISKKNFKRKLGNNLDININRIQASANYSTSRDNRLNVPNKRALYMSNRRSSGTNISAKGLKRKGIKKSKDNIATIMLKLKELSVLPDRKLQKKLDYFITPYNSGLVYK